MKKHLKKYAIITFGAIIFSLSVNLFLIPSKIVTGGLSGVATILYHTFGIPAGFVVGGGNIIVCLWALHELGLKFVLNSLYGIFATTFFVSVTSFLPTITNDLFISTVFGGILLGIGVGFTFMQDGTTGGTDIVSRIVQKKQPHLSIGLLMTITDLVIISVSYAVFRDFELSMYGIISLVVSTAVIDGIIGKLNSGVLVYIITKDAELMKRAILDSLERGVTIIEAKGGFSEERKQILMCVMKKKDMENLKKTAKITEENSFVIVTPSKEVFGEGFHYYK